MRVYAEVIGICVRNLMAAFGEVKFLLTAKLMQSVLVQSEGVVYQFRLRKWKVDRTESWSCTTCESRRRRDNLQDPIPCIQLDPQHPSHEHFCGGENPTVEPL